MKSMRMKKAVVTALVAVMMAGSIGVMPQGVSEVQAAESEIKDVNLGTKGISNPNSSTAEGWQGSQVYYAGKLCYVLDKDGELKGNSSQKDSMLLLTKEVINSQAFNVGSTSDWSTSSVRNNINSITLAEADGGFLNSFSAVEQIRIADTSISKANTTGNDYTTYPSVSTNDKIFLLDLADVGNAAYGFDSDFVRAKGTRWWLRSPGRSSDTAADVDGVGYIASGGVGVDSVGNGVRPAFNLNLDSVLFTSVSGVNKSVFGPVGNTNVGANIWNLTLKDGDTDFAAKLPETAALDQDITVEVTQVGTGTEPYTQTSAILADSDGTVIAYGRIGETGTGVKTFKIPAGITQGNYTLQVFEEQANTGNLTSYASNVVTQNIKIGLGVTITPGSGMTKTSESGAEIQTGLITEPMKDVVYTADAGYYFPTDYSVAKVNEIKVTREGFTQITVSGTPTASTAITLAGATEKGTSAVPTGLSDGVGKIAGTKTTMQYAARADAPANEWMECTDGNTTVAAGTWYVRYKETDTQKAGGTAKVTVAASENPPTLYQVTVHSGSGDGSYAEKAKVTITADAPESGKKFKEWKVVSGGVSLEDKTSQTTTFTMPSHAVEVSAVYENAVPQKTTYTITDGAGTAYTIGSGKTLTITCSGALADLTGIYADEKQVDAKHYTLKSGSTILTLKTSYLDSLSVGTHNLTFAYGEGSAKTTFEVKAAPTKAATPATDTPVKKERSPKTGDNTTVLWLFTLVLTGGAGVCYFGRKKKRSR